MKELFKTQDKKSLQNNGAMENDNDNDILYYLKTPSHVIDLLVS